MSTVNWSKVPIHKLPIRIIDGDRSKRYPKRSEFQNEGIAFLNSTNIVDNRLVLQNGNFISEAKYDAISKGRVKHGDIIMTTRGSIGKVALVDRRRIDRALINAQMLLLRAEGEAVDSAFLYYVMCSTSFQAELRGFASGSAQPQIPITDLKHVSIPVPPLTIQRKIASILSAYDDLIENNQRRIKILEEMAQNLYREWFVKFRFPGHENVRFVDSTLGKIPEGWEIVPLSLAIDVRPKLTIPKDQPTKYVPMGSVSETTMIVGPIEERPRASGARFQNGDTLMARITPSLENGKTGYVHFLSSENEVACGSTEFIVLRSRTVTPEYVYLLARSNELRDIAIKSMSGASGRQRVNEGIFDEFRIAQPVPSVLKQFRKHTKPMFELVFCLGEKNKTLKRSRDLLLPKLISGELDVSELDIRTPEEVAE